MVGQKAKGTPKIWVKLTRVEGVAASDAMSTISVGIFKNLQKQSVSLCTGLLFFTLSTSYIVLSVPHYLESLNASKFYYRFHYLPIDIAWTLYDIKQFSLVKSTIVSK